MPSPNADAARSSGPRLVDAPKKGSQPGARPGLRRVLAIGSIAVLAQSAALLLLAETVRRRRRNEETIRRLVQRINRAREEEQRHLARELHDNLGQRLSLLSIRLASLGHLRSSNDPASEELWAIGRELDDLISEVHDLSHRMHSSRLEHLGLEEALKELCKEISSRGRMEIAFRVKGALGIVSPPASLCFYRIAQEALNNVLRHSGASRAQVVLTGAGQRLAMQVIDDGIGFDTEAASYGLGLTSIRERILSVNGAMSLMSSPGNGTSILIQAPVHCLAHHGAGEAEGERRRESAKFPAPAPP